jgi:hypothetical protein
MLICDEPLVSVLPRRHRLAQARQIRLDDLNGERLVLFPREQNPELYDYVLTPAALADGEGCYSNGVAHDCVSPSPVYMGTGSDSTTVAGPTMQAPSGPYQDWRLQNMGM